MMILETDRALLSTVVLSDKEDIQTLYQNDEVRKFLGGSVEAAVFSEKFDASLNAENEGIDLVIRKKENSQFLGLVNISPAREKPLHEVSYQLDPTYWRQGYGTEILVKIIEYARQELTFESLIAETQKRNIASIRLLEKVGMQFHSEVERFGETQCIYKIRLDETK